MTEPTREQLEARFDRTIPRDGWGKQQWDDMSILAAELIDALRAAEEREKRMLRSHEETIHTCNWLLKNYIYDHEWADVGRKIETMREDSIEAIEELEKSHE